MTRPLRISCVLVVATIVLGLGVRRLPLGLPQWFVKYAGSTLWALMIYWIVSTLLPVWRLTNVALVSGSVATAVEFGKVYHSPALDAFRLTLPGVLLLGRVFSWWDIVAYWLAIGVGMVVDHRLRFRGSDRSRPRWLR